MKFKKFIFTFLFLFISFFFINESVSADVTDDFFDVFNKEVLSEFSYYPHIIYSYEVNGKQVDYYYISKSYLLKYYEYIYNSKSKEIIFYNHSSSNQDHINYSTFNDFVVDSKIYNGNYITIRSTNPNEFGFISSDNLIFDKYFLPYQDFSIYDPGDNLYPKSIFNREITNLDDWHFSEDLYDTFGNLIKKADLDINPVSLGSVVTSKENLNYNSIIDVFNDRLQTETDYDYNNFIFHTIYEDVNTSDLTSGTYHIAFYDDSIDFEFADVPEKNDGRAHSVGSYNYYLNKGNKKGSIVCRTSFNSLDDLQNTSKIKCEPVSYIESKGDYYDVLWANNPVSLFYKNWLGVWTYKDYFNKVSSYESFSDKLELAPNEVVLFKPINHSSSYTTKYAINNVFESGWISYLDNNYSFISNTMTSLREYIYVNDILNYKSIYSLDVYSTYLSNNYYYSISNRNSSSNLSVWYNSEDLQPFIFRTDTTSLTDGDIVLNNPISYVREEMNKTFGSFKDTDYESLTKQELSDKGINSNVSSGVIDNFFDISKTIETAKDFFSAFGVIGSMVTTFMETMPPLIANGLYALFSLGIIVCLIKLFL